MSLFVCLQCGWTYDETEGLREQGIPPRTGFRDLPDRWECPFCGAAGCHFEETDDP